MQRKIITENIEKVPGKSISSGLIKRVEACCSTSGKELLKHLIELCDSVVEPNLEIGGMFFMIMGRKLHLELGYKNWETFLEDEFNLSKHKVEGLIYTYIEEKYFFEKGSPESN